MLRTDDERKLGSSHGRLCKHPKQVRQALGRGVTGSVLQECLAVHHGHHWYSAKHQSERDEEPHLHTAETELLKSAEQQTHTKRPSCACTCDGPV